MPIPTLSPVVRLLCGVAPPSGMSLLGDTCPDDRDDVMMVEEGEETMVSAAKSVDLHLTCIPYALKPYRPDVVTVLGLCPGVLVVYTNMPDRSVTIEHISVV